MEIKINLTISADSNLLAALQALAGGGVKATPVITATENGEVKKPRKVKEEKTDEPGPVKETVPVIKITEEVKTEHTLDSVRALAVPRSKAGHRAAIKEKITELGYESLENMQPVHFNEFVTFLNTIPLPQA